MRTPLEHLAWMMWAYNYEGGDGEVDWEAELPCLETVADLGNYLARPEIREGMHSVELYDPGDGILVVFVDGEMKAIGYVSSRGTQFQAGAFDGAWQYSATNLWDQPATPTIPQWTRYPSIAAQITEDAWWDLTGQLKNYKPWRKLRGGTDSS